MAELSERYNEVDNESHQRRLAETLINAMGINDAIQWCERTRWDGTLRAILACERSQGD